MALTDSEARQARRLREWARAAGGKLRYAGLIDGRLVDDLCNRGLATKEEDAEVGRGGVMTLTPSGMAR